MLRPIVRRLLGDPSYAVAFVATLGLGIGATTAIFSAVEGILIRPLPYPSADRIVYIEQPETRTGRRNASFSFVEIADFRNQASSMEELVEYGDWQFSVVGQGEPHLAYGGLVTSNYFTVLNIRPHLGRALVSDDDIDGAAPVAVLTYEYWQRVFGADPNIVSRVIELTGVASTIVGVLEPGSHYAGTERAELYANYSTNSHYMGATMQGDRRHRMTDVYGLIRRDVPLPQARSEMEAIATRLHAAFPADYAPERGYGIRLTPWRDVLVAEARGTLLILMGAVALVLIVACANVGNLTVARLVRRERELAIRGALGATPRQLRAQLLGEHLVLAGAGAIVGAGIAWLGLGLLVDYAARMTLRSEEVGINASVLSFSLAVGVGVAVLLAWAPRLPAASAAPLAGGAGTRTTAARSQRRIQRFLVVGQVAVSFVVLAGAGLLTRSVLNLQRVERGFDTSSVIALKAPNFTRSTPEHNRAIFDALVEQISAFPGVQAVSTATSAPFDRLTLYAWQFRVEGATPELIEQPVQLIPQTVSPDYFDTLRLPIVRGRAFGAQDVNGGEPAVVINQSLAVRLFGSDSPIGRKVQWSFDGRTWPGWRTVVGVSRDARELGPQSPPVPTAYQSAEQASPGPAVLIRSAGDPTAAAREAARLVHDMDPKRPVTDVWTLDTAFGEHVAPSRLNASLFGAFALLAVVIAAVGLGGVLAFAVSARTREFGIRMALGSARGRILRGVIGEGLGMAVLGLVVGAVTAGALAGFMQDILFEVRPLDLPTYVVAAAALLTIAAAASWLPARRATHVEPTVALRAD